MPDWLGLQALAEQEKAKRINARMAADGIPPLDFAPQATPVGALKNQVAFSNQYTPEAAEILQQTPTQVRYSPTDEGETLYGYYVPPGPTPRIDRLNAAIGLLPNPQIVVENMDEYSSPANTLAHEFAHKWQSEQAPLARQGEWQAEWPSLVDPWVVERVGGRDESGDPYAAGMEAYAHQAELGPQALSPETRGYYYPGLYQTGIAPPAQGPMQNPYLASSFYDPSYDVPTAEVAEYVHQERGHRGPPPHYVPSLWDFAPGYLRVRGG